MAADKKISELPLASSISASDVSILVKSNTDYQYTFTQLLQFVANNVSSGARISFGTSLPQNTVGSNGDLFINTSAGSFAQKIAGNWVIAYTVPEANGADGTLLYGAGLPGSGTGKNLDSYINTISGIFYKKSGGSWSQVFSMATGPQGLQGIPGTNGINGTNGNSILFGSANPSNSSTGANGDFYINTGSYHLFGPKAGGTWPAGVALTGPQGEQGIQGLQGGQGVKGDKGDTGDTGPAGEAGTTGPAGPTGATGVAGPKGDKGDQGDTGPAGVTGPAGATGAAGAAGPAGTGLPAGGAAGQVPKKNSNTDYDIAWSDPPAGVSKAASADINTATDDAKFATALALAGSKYLDQSGSKISATASGTNTYTATLSPAISAYSSQQVFFIKFTNANTGASSLNLNSLGAKILVKNGSAPLVANDIPAGAVMCVSYDGTNFQVINSFPAAIPTVTSGEKLLSITSAGVQKSYDAVDQVVSASALTTADFSTGAAAVTGIAGQYSYDSNYRYDCVGSNLWRRAALNGNLIDLYLADIDDTAGAKTSAQLQTAYPSSLMGQQAWGTNYLYIKKSSTGWKKIAIADA